MSRTPLLPFQVLLDWDARADQDEAEARRGLAELRAPRSQEDAPWPAIAREVDVLCMRRELPRLLVGRGDRDEWR